jgi:hypothetical protein
VKPRAPNPKLVLGEHPITLEPFCTMVGLWALCRQHVC